MINCDQLSAVFNFSINNPPKLQFSRLCIQPIKVSLTLSQCKVNGQKLTVLFQSFRRWQPSLLAVWWSVLEPVSLLPQWSVCERVGKCRLAASDPRRRAQARCLTPRAQRHHRHGAQRHHQGSLFGEVDILGVSHPPTCTIQRMTM